jgi:FixJ family two-component response regulator
LNTSGQPCEGMEDSGLVVIVDDDDTLRRALASLFQSVGLEVKAVSTAAELLALEFPDAPTCVVLDVRLRGVSGLELQSQLAQAGAACAIVFITGYGDISMSVAAMKAGAVDFIEKPFRDHELLEAVYAGLTHDRERRQNKARTRHLHADFDHLSPREREVMGLAAHGLMNKQIAGKIGISEATVKIYRGQAMSKMHARSFAELVVMAQSLGLTQVLGRA